MWNVVVIGGGIAGLTTAYALRKQAAVEGRPLRVGLVESAPRLGGKIVGERSSGFLLEGGPDSFITLKPQALELVRELGLEDQIVAANDAHRTTYVVKDGRLVPLPEGLRLLVPERWEPLIASPVLSWGAKLRMAREKTVPPRASDDDESVADFVRRRLGQEALERLAEPLLAHIHVADVERMSLQATYPRLAELERRHGSLSNAVQALRSRPRGKTGPVFLTLRDGLCEVVERLAKQLPPESLYLGRRVRALDTVPSGDYAVRLEDGTRLETQSVVLAVPAFAAAEIAAPLDRQLARRLAAIRYTSLATLSLGYRRADIDHPLAGYGFFVPRCEMRTALACTWTSSKFAHRVADGDVLLRLFVGGAGHEELLEHDDESLVGRLREDLRRLMEIDAEPRLARLYRWPRGYPQYEVGHLDRVRAIEDALPAGVTIAGSAYHGVGLPDCIASAQRAARRVLERLSRDGMQVDGAGPRVLNTAGPH